jgi:hypothetical protein
MLEVGQGKSESGVPLKTVPVFVTICGTNRGLLFDTVRSQEPIRVSENMITGRTSIGGPMTDLSIYTSEAPAGETQLLLQGSLEAVETNEVDGPIIYVHGRGSANTTELNGFTVRFEAIVHNDEKGVGTGTLIAHYAAPNGDSIFAEASGRGAPTSVLGVNRIVEKYTITGGTGRFAGISGSFIVERLLTLATGVSSGTISGTIVP